MSACATSAPADDPDAADLALCGADRLDRFIGMRASTDVRSQIAATAGPRPTRYIGPDDAVTMDYLPDRLNADLRANGEIWRFRCG